MCHLAEQPKIHLLLSQHQPRHSIPRLSSIEARLEAHMASIPTIPMETGNNPRRSPPNATGGTGSSWPLSLEEQATDCGCLRNDT
jgi:hypothetical protein